MKKVISVLLTFALVGFCSAQSSFTVYDNTQNDLSTTFAISSGEEVGDQVILDASNLFPPYTLNYFSFTYWGVNFSGDEQMIVKIYRNDGANGAPGTVLWASDPFTLPETPKSQIIFDTDFSVGSVPSTFTWSVLINGLTSGESAGLWLFSPPAVGTNYTDFWYNNGSGWQLRVGNVPIDFEAKVGAVAVPPTVSITAPTDGADIGINANVNITATATDSDGWISKVEFYVGPTKIGEDTTAPFSATWQATVPGSYSIWARATDSQNLTADSTPINVIVHPNSPPTFTKGPDITVPEDSPAQTITGWATNIDPGAPYESHQIVSFIVANDNNSLFTVQPAIDTNGTLTFTPAPNANGQAEVIVVAKDDGGTLGGGNDTSVPQTFTITITPVNDKPVVSAVSVTTEEDTITSITLMGTDIDGDTLTYSVVTPPAHGTVTSIVGNQATYVPAADYNGTDSFTYRAYDGTEYSDPATVSITITAVQDVKPAYFAPAVDFPTDTTPAAIAVGDFIKDGKNDVAIGCAATATINIFQGDGQGSFTQVNTIQINGTPVAMASADFNLDNKLDIAVAVAENKIIILWNQDNAGAFNATEVSINNTPAGLVIGRFDSDSRPDLATATPDGVTIVYNGGSGVFDFASVGDNSNIAAGDFNRDGRVDLAIVDSTANTVTVLKQNPGYTFSAFTNLNVGNTPIACDFVDLNGDRYADLVVANADSMNLTIWFYSAISSSFSTSTNIYLGLTPSSVKAVDVDKDGINDLVVATQDGLLVVLKGQAGGVFKYYAGDSNIYTQIGDGNKVIAVSEFNRDANPDLAIVNSGSDSFSVLINNRFPKVYKGTIITMEDNPVEFQLQGTYGPLDYIIVGPPLNGTYVALTPLLNTTEGPRIRYTPNPDYFGRDYLDFMGFDGVRASTVARMTIIVKSVNDQPSFQISTTEITVDEDSPITMIYNFIQNLSKGPVNESRQSIRYLISNSNSNLFERQPTINYLGTLTFKPKKNAYGTAVVTVLAKDSGGTANGGVDTSEPQTFTITVENINDPPVITKVIGTQTIYRNTMGAFQVYVNDIETAPGDLDLTVTSANQNLISDSDITLTNFGNIRLVQFTPVQNAFGRALMTFTVSDGTNSASKSVWVTIR